MDQLSMVQLLSPEVNKFNVDCKILDESWNYRGSDSGRLAPTDLKVNHHPDLRNRYFSRDTVIAALRYQSAGNLDTSLDLLNWIDREQPGDIDIMKLLVLCRLQRQEYAEAGGALDRMLQQFPGYPWAESAKAKIEALTSGAAPSHPQS
jgi:predicted Zn-dependent protease